MATLQTGNKCWSYDEPVTLTIAFKLRSQNSIKICSTKNIEQIWQCTTYENFVTVLQRISAHYVRVTSRLPALVLRCTYKCLGKLWAVITRKFMRWIAPSKFQVCRKQQYRTYPMFGLHQPNVTGKMERNPCWKICVTPAVTRVYSILWATFARWVLMLDSIILGLMFGYKNVL